MLILTRKTGESIMVGGAEITIIEIRKDAAGNRVRLGITAPKEMPVHRREVYDAIQRQRQEKK